MAVTSRPAERARIPNGLARFRAERQLTQGSAARRARLPRWIWNRIERGVFLPSAAELQKIARVLGVTPEHLYSKAALEVIGEAERAA